MRWITDLICHVLIFVHNIKKRHRIRWVHLAHVLKEDRLTIFVNGEQIAERDLSKREQPPGPLEMTLSYHLGVKMNGKTYVDNLANRQARCDEISHR